MAIYTVQCISIGPESSICWVKTNLTTPEFGRAYICKSSAESKTHISPYYHHVSYEIVNHWAHTPVSDTAIYFRLGTQGSLLHIWIGHFDWVEWWIQMSTCRFRSIGGQKRRTPHQSQNIAVLKCFKCLLFLLCFQWWGCFAHHVEIRFCRLRYHLEPFCWAQKDKGHIF